MKDKPYLEPSDWARFYPCDPRYTILSGKYGPYFHDSEGDYPMTLVNVLDKLNKIDALKARLFKANKRKRGEKW